MATILGIFGFIDKINQIEEANKQLTEDNKGLEQNERMQAVYEEAVEENQAWKDQIRVLEVNIRHLKANAAKRDEEAAKRDEEAAKRDEQIAHLLAQINPRMPQSRILSVSHNEPTPVLP